MQNPAHNTSSRITVSIEKIHDDCLINLRSNLEREFGRRFTISEIIRMAIIKLNSCYE